MEKSLGSLYVRLGAKTDFSSARAGLKNLGDSARQVGGQLTRYLTLQIAGFGALTLKTAGDFEAAMNQVRAVSGATSAEFDSLRKTARELGATTQYSAGQAADAMSFLAMAGFDANEVIGAIPGTLQLAASAQMDLGRTADVVSNILTGYRMDVSELTHVNDVLVKSFTSANTDLEQLGEAMKYAGPVASAAGVRFEEAAAALSMMGNAGIQASMAGTSLRGAIARILSPTDKAKEAMDEAGLSFTDAEGRLKSLDQIVQELEPHAEDAGLFIELFGQRAGPGMAALVSQGSQALRDLTQELDDSAGTAARIAAVQMEGFNGAMRELMSAFQELMLSIADSGLLQWATDFAKATADMTRQIAALDPEILKWATVLAGAAAAIGPLLVSLGLLSAALAAISAPVALTVTGGAAVAALLVGISGNFDDMSDSADTFEDKATRAAVTVARAFGHLQDTLYYTDLGFKKIQYAATTAAYKSADAWATALENDVPFSNWLQNMSNAGRGLVGLGEDTTDYAAKAQAARNDVNSLGLSMDQLALDINSLQDAAPPSAGIEKWISEVTAQMDELGSNPTWRALQEWSGNAPQDGSGDDGGGGNGGGGGGNGGGSGQTSQEAQDRLDALLESLRTQEESEIASYQKQLSDLEEFHNQQAISDEKYHDLRERAEQMHQQKMSDIRQQAADADARMREQNLGYVTSTLQSISQIMDSEGNKQIGIQKAISVAIAAINVAEGITKALTLPFPANLLAAASVAAQGAAQIAAINHASRGNGSVTSPRGSSSHVRVPSSESSSETSGGTGTPGRAVNIQILGETFGKEQVRNLIAQIQSEIDDGATLITSSQ